MPLSPCCRALGLIGAFVVGCAAPAAGPRRATPIPAARAATTDPAQALREGVGDQLRVDAVALTLLSRSASLCPAAAVRGRLGLRALTASDYAPGWRDAAVRALGISDSVTVVGIVPGSPAAEVGLRPGDRLLRVGAELLREGPGASAHFREVLGRALAGAGPVPVLVERGDTFLDPTLRPRRACDVPTVVVEGDVATAFAGGASIYLTAPLLHAVTDPELAVIVAHELAHIVLGHVPGIAIGSGAPGEASEQPALPRLAGLHPEPPGAAGTGRAFSLEQERAADELSLSAVALAGIPPDAVPAFWRRAGGGALLELAAAHAAPDRPERLARAIVALRRPAVGPTPMAAAPQAAPAREAAAPPPSAVSAPPAPRREAAAPPPSAVSAPPAPARQAAAPAVQPTPAGPKGPVVLGVPVTVAPPAAPKVLGVPVSAPPRPRLVVITGEPAWLYAAPDIESAPIGRIARGATVTVRSEKGDWLEVDAPTGRGYLLAQDARPAVPPR